MNEHEKNASIDYILSKGLVKPQTAWARVIEMSRMIGFRYIFWDTGYSLFFAAVTLAAVLTLFAIAPDNYRYSASVTVAPLMFLFVTLYTETSERACGLYELKQTCRYTVGQITALRVVCYSVAGAAFTAIIAMMGARDWHEFLSLFPLCLTALTVCAVLSLTVMRFFRGKWANAVFLTIWVFANAGLTLSNNDKWEIFLSGVPVVVSLVTALAGVALLVCQISRMLSEVKRYAVA